MADDYANDKSTTATLSVNTSITGRIDSADDWDWFRLDLEPDRAYKFSATTAQGTEPLVYVWDETAQWSDFTNEPYVLVSNELANPFTFTKPGHQYYLKVRNDAPTSYTIGLTLAPDDFDNSAAAARGLAIGTSARASFDYMFDTEHYRIDAQAGMTYTVTLRTAVGAVPDDAWLRLSSSALAYGTSSEGVRGADGMAVSFTAAETRMYDIAAVLAGYDPLAAPIKYTVGVTARDASAPALKSSTGFIDGKFTFVFDEAVKLGTGTIGFDYKALPANAITVAGNTVTVDLGHNLAPGNYTIQFNKDALSDLLGNYPQWGYFPSVSVQNPVGGKLAGYVLKSDGARSLNGSTDTTDVALYEGTAADYSVSARAGGGFSMTHANGIVDTLTGIDRLYFTGSDDVIGLSLEGNLGQIYRLYKAAFDRTPDKSGLGFWLAASDAGVTLLHIAGQFVISPEFQQKYGTNTSNAAYVDALYHNVLHRDGDAEGVAFWNNALDHGAERGRILIDFSDSVENQAATAALVGDGFAYTPWA
ncbi:DUF4214 domain-containing protein [Pseudoduganella armeniaca]|uniref:DUF4214 domain-containing protein n=1 Tax=Pseudoduganella armeniaca TaxID=2072590 RepID=A0A2R4C8Y0_9BURK|nr:DUF4214 domain-containing protein [Pseudoduganella armeniaca]AVR96089.1 hypothetical protein C9I28_10405 [Pseudoduganella armeniaca]